MVLCGFYVVSHKDRAFSHHLEVGPLPSNFICSSGLGPFLRDDEVLGSSKEVVDFEHLQAFGPLLLEIVSDHPWYLCWNTSLRLGGCYTSSGPWPSPDLL